MTEVLVIINRDEKVKISKFTKFFAGLIRPFKYSEISKRIKILFNEEYFKVYLLNTNYLVNKDNNFKTKQFSRVFTWLKENSIGNILFEDIIEDDCKKIINESSIKNGIKILQGNKISLAVSLNALKRYSKNQGISLGEIDTLVVTDGTYPFETDLIGYLAGQTKFLTYFDINNNSDSINIDDIFLETGFSIRTCTSLDECINDIGIIINLCSSYDVSKHISSIQDIVILNMQIISETNKKNIHIINSTVVDTSERFGLNLDNKASYGLVEAYLFKDVQKPFLSEKSIHEINIDNIFDMFKSQNFRISEVKGVNL